jgi:hypothetical protein
MTPVEDSEMTCTVVSCLLILWDDGSVTETGVWSTHAHRGSEACAVTMRHEPVTPTSNGQWTCANICCQDHNRDFMRLDVSIPLTDALIMSCTLCIYYQPYL